MGGREMGWDGRERDGVGWGGTGMGGIDEAEREQKHVTTSGVASALL